jgi:hypothetical protein
MSNINRYKNIIAFVDSYNKNPEAKLVYVNIFNILTKHKKVENYTLNNNGIHFILNEIDDTVIDTLENYIINFKNNILEKEKYEEYRDKMTSSFKNSYYSGGIDYIEERSSIDYTPQFSDIDYDDNRSYDYNNQDLFGDEDD